MKVRIPSDVRLGLILIIVFMVVSSPIVMLVNPVLANTPSASSSSPPLPTISTIPSAPSTIGQDGREGDFTTQATLSSLTARPTNNIVNTNSFYDVVFLAATSGTIKTIEVTFPVGTTIPSGAFFNEAEGIGPGTASKSGQTIIYTVTNAVNVPAGTKIRLEFANINNPLNPSASYQVTVTTRNAANTPIDGPTPSTAYTIKQIGQNAIAESFMKRVTVLDNPIGNSIGWNPDGVENFFVISGQGVSGSNTAFISIETVEVNGVNRGCEVIGQGIDFFRIRCSDPPGNTAELHFVLTNLKPNIVG